VADSIRALVISYTFHTGVVGIAVRCIIIKAVLVFKTFYANVFFCADTIVTIIIGQAGYTCIISCAYQPISTVRTHFTFYTSSVRTANGKFLSFAVIVDNTL